MYAECRFTPLDHPPQRSIGDHQLMNHQSDTVQNNMYLPPINTSTPFQPHNQNPILVQQQAQSDPSDVVAQHLQQHTLNQSQLHDTLSSIFSCLQNLWQEMVSVMNEMSKRHENGQFIRDIHIFDNKNIYFDEWIAQIEKVVLLTGKSEYLLALAKSSNTPYKMILQCPTETPWGDLKCKLQEVYSMVAMDYHTTTDLLRKQRPIESLQDYITYWMEMCQCSMKMDPSAINNKLVILLFFKNMYMKEI